MAITLLRTKLVSGILATEAEQVQAGQASPAHRWSGHGTVGRLWCAISLSHGSSAPLIGVGFLLPGLRGAACFPLHPLSRGGEHCCPLNKGAAQESHSCGSSLQRECRGLVGAPVWSRVHSAPASRFSRNPASLGGPSSQLWDWQWGAFFSLNPQEKLVSGNSALLLCGRNCCLLRRASQKKALGPKTRGRRG